MDRSQQPFLEKYNDISALKYKLNKMSHRICGVFTFVKPNYFVFGYKPYK